MFNIIFEKTFKVIYYSNLIEKIILVIGFFFGIYILYKIIRYILYLIWISKFLKLLRKLIGDEDDDDTEIKTKKNNATAEDEVNKSHGNEAKKAIEAEKMMREENVEQDVSQRKKPKSRIVGIALDSMIKGKGVFTRKFAEEMAAKLSRLDPTILSEKGFFQAMIIAQRASMMDKSQAHTRGGTREDR